MWINAMEVTAENRRRQRKSRFLIALMAINVGFALGVLLWWHWMSVIVSEPMRWATWQALGPRPSLLDYPFVILWGMPVSAIGGAWFARQFGNMRLACGFAFFPVFYLSLIIGWFYLTPVTWH
jgi:hypothetical protein